MRLIAIMVVVITRSLAAQTPAAGTPTAVTMMSAAFTRHANELARHMAAYSLQDRRTPSAALDRAAQYAAAKFTAMRLPPGIIRSSGSSRDSMWIQRYPLPWQPAPLDTAKAKLVFRYSPKHDRRDLVADGRPRVMKEVVLPITAAQFVVPRVPQARTYARYAPPVAVLTGRPTPAFLRGTDLAHKTVLYVPPADLDSAGRHAVVHQLYAADQQVLLLADVDSARWAAQQTPRRPPPRLVPRYLRYESEEEPHPWALAVHPTALGDLLPALELDVAAARMATAPAVRDLPGLKILLHQEFDTTAVTTVETAPNVAGFLRGSDERLKNYCVVVTAPLDHRSVRSNESDRLRGSVDATTGSLAGLLALAQAFSQLEERLKYSVVFLATSGGGADGQLWGSEYYAYSEDERPCSPVLAVVLDLNVGELLAGDTAVIGGLNAVELAMPPAWAAVLHPELKLAVVDGGSVLRSRSDATAFSRRGVPSIVLQGGRVSDEPVQGDRAARVALDLERTARLLGLVFHVAYGVANAEEPPRWTTAGRKSFGQ